MSFAVALLPLLIAAGASVVARAAYARGVLIPHVMRAGPWGAALPDGGAGDCVTVGSVGPDGADAPHVGRAE